MTLALPGGRAHRPGTPSRAAVPVRDDDGTPEVSIADAGSVTEGGTLEFPVGLSGLFHTRVTVDCTLSGTAVAGEDHDGAASGTVTFVPGETEKVIRLVTDEGAAGNERMLEEVKKGSILPTHRLRDRKRAAVVEADRDRTFSRGRPGPSMSAGTVVALSGGIGGAKLVLGLYRVLRLDTLTVICNPGDDFDHLGLRICPDADTVLYTLAGIANPETGWGRAGETWTFMEVLADIGGETWFRLGDGDLALHVERTRRIAAGEPPSRVAEDLARRFGVRARVVPACDAPVRTMVGTRGGRLPFQHYFVRDRCEPAVTGFEFEGAAEARPCGAALEALADPSLRCVVVCPSNPFISIDPILAVPGMRAAVRAAGDRGLADHRGPRGQGSHREDDARARYRGLEPRHRASLRGSRRCLDHRPGGRRGRGRLRTPRARRPDPDAHRRGQGRPRTGGAGARGRALLCNRFRDTGAGNRRAAGCCPCGGGEPDFANSGHWEMITH